MRIEWVLGRGGGEEVGGVGWRGWEGDRKGWEDGGGVVEREDRGGEVQR